MTMQRMWAASGAIAVLLFAAGLLFGDVLGSSSYPPVNASFQRAQSYFMQNHSEVRALSFFHVLSALALLCFTAYLQMWLRRLDQRSARLAPVSLAGGVMAAAFLLLSALIYRVLAEPTVVHDESLTHALLVSSYLAGGPAIAIPLTLPIVAGTLTSFRRALLPRWIGWLGVAAVVVSVLSAGVLLGPLNNSSLWYGVLLLSAILALVWTFATSVTLAAQS